LSFTWQDGVLIGFSLSVSVLMLLSGALF